MGSSQADIAHRLVHHRRWVWDVGDLGSTSSGVPATVTAYGRPPAADSVPELLHLSMEARLLVRLRQAVAQAICTGRPWTWGMSSRYDRGGDRCVVQLRRDGRPTWRREGPALGPLLAEALLEVWEG